MLHLITESEWAAVQLTGWIAPVSLETEGFVHCTDGDEMMVGVANRFYGAIAEAVFAVTIDESRLSAPVVREPPAHPDGRAAAPDEPLFPHVYGPMELDAVADRRRLVRAADGTYVGYAAI